MKKYFYLFFLLLVACSKNENINAVEVCSFIEEKCSLYLERNPMQATYCLKIYQKTSCPNKKSILELLCLDDSFECTPEKKAEESENSASKNGYPRDLFVTELGMESVKTDRD